MNPWFDEFAGRWQKLAALHQAAIASPELDAAVAHELLELARVAAHTAERRFAPLASYVSGMAVERMLRARPELTQEEVAAVIRELWQELEGSA